MRIWLDDERQMPDGYDLHIKKASVLIKLLSKGRSVVSFISFDHDLGDDKDGTGYSVATYIEEMAQAQRIARIEWKIHSANPVGEKNITAAMESAERFWDLYEHRSEHGVYS